jgi:hypothetical protein
VRPQLILVLGESNAAVNYPTNKPGALQHLVASLAPGTLRGLLAALVLAAFPSAGDWYYNPAGIFRTNLDTNWTNLLETFWSWLWPLALLTVPCAIVVLWVRRVRRN